MTTALITGASRGIGHAVASALLGEGVRVIAAVRSPEKFDLPGAEAEALDVGSPASISALAGRLHARGEQLDVLVNNAGVYRAKDREIWDVNLRGPLLLTEALASLLQPAARVVMVSSGLGATSGQDPRLVQRLETATLESLRALAAEAPGGYGASKAALNALARVFAAQLGPRGVLVNSVDPGWVRTEMGGKGAPRSIDQGAASVLWACRLKPGGQTGGFFRDGRALPF